MNGIPLNIPTPNVFRMMCQGATSWRDFHLLVALARGWPSVRGQDALLALHDELVSSVGPYPGDTP